MEKKIRVTCKCKDFLPISELEPFQGGLKSIDSGSMQKLRNSILKYGVSYPMFVWENGGKKYLIDGHQRLSAIKQLNEEGYNIKEVPVVYIQAKGIKEAKEKLLIATSKYGFVTEEGFLDFIKDLEGVEDWQDTIVIPDINVDFLLEEASAGDFELPDVEITGAQQQNKIIYFYFKDDAIFQEAVKKLGGSVTAKHSVSIEGEKLMELLK